MVTMKDILNLAQSAQLLGVELDDLPIYYHMRQYRAEFPVINAVAYERHINLHYGVLGDPRKLYFEHMAIGLEGFTDHSGRVYDLPFYSHGVACQRVSISRITVGDKTFPAIVLY